MKRIPTDLEILEEIYRRYYSDFAAYSSENPGREAKVYVPINIALIAESFSIDPDIVHGRLYYHLDEKYGMTRRDGKIVPFFRFVENTDAAVRHQVQFPLLAAVVATLRESRNQYLRTIWIAAASLGISLIALVLSSL